MTVKIDGIEPNIFPEVKHLDVKDAGENVEVTLIRASPQHATPKHTLRR